MVKFSWRCEMILKWFCNTFKLVTKQVYIDLEHEYNRLKMEYDRLKMEYERLQNKPNEQAYKMEQLEKRIAQVERTNTLLLRGLGVDEFARVLQEAEARESRKNKSKNKIKGSEKTYE